MGGAQRATGADRQAIINGLKNRQFDKVGKVLSKLVIEELLSQATDESATMLADGNLSVAEVNRWLGDG